MSFANYFVRTVVLCLNVLEFLYKACKIYHLADISFHECFTHSSVHEGLTRLLLIFDMLGFGAVVLSSVAAESDLFSFNVKSALLR
jgi:hypothetical protein